MNSLRSASQTARLALTVVRFVGPAGAGAALALAHGLHPGRVKEQTNATYMRRLPPLVHTGHSSSITTLSMTIILWHPLPPDNDCQRLSSSGSWATFWFR
jgi:hypothetical protein